MYYASEPISILAFWLHFYIIFPYFYFLLPPSGGPHKTRPGAFPLPLSAGLHILSVTSSAHGSEVAQARTLQSSDVTSSKVLSGHKLRGPICFLLTHRPFRPSENFVLDDFFKSLQSPLKKKKYIYIYINNCGNRYQCAVIFSKVDFHLGVHGAPKNWGNEYIKTLLTLK